MLFTLPNQHRISKESIILRAHGFGHHVDSDTGALAHFPGKPWEPVWTGVPLLSGAIFKQREVDFRCLFGSSDLAWETKMQAKTNENYGFGDLHSLLFCYSRNPEKNKGAKLSCGFSSIWAG
jgi:hypothetical protein